MTIKNSSRLLFLIFIAFFLAACSTTGRKSHNSGYTKPPEHVTVGAGPNRKLAVYALQFIGTPYVFGGSSPSQGFDCSGLVQWSAKKALHLNVPRTTAKQSQFGKKLDQNSAQAGDLVFFNINGQPNSHVGIYLGDSFFIHAPSSNGVIRVESLNNPYWRPRFSYVRRIQ